MVDPSVQVQIERLWLELSALRQSLNARPIAPTPDYRSDLPAEEPCSCEESERLKAELGDAHVRIQELESERDVERQGGAALRRMLTKVEWQLANADALLREWHSLDPDDEDPARSLYTRTAAHLSSQPAASVPGSVLRDGSWIRTPEEERGQPAATPWSEYPGDRGPLGDHG